MIYLLVAVVIIFVLVRNSEWFIEAVSNRRYRKAIESLEKHLEKDIEKSKDKNNPNQKIYKGIVENIKENLARQKEIIYKFERVKTRYAHDRDIRRNLINDWDEYTQALDDARINDEVIVAGVDPLSDPEKIWIKWEEIEKRFDKLLKEK